jgi:serine/threonine-protein kinase
MRWRSRAKIARPGRLIAGRYRLDAPLGRGAMGEIWSAEHVRLKSRVAVKFLDASIADDPEMLDRFMREAQSAAAVRSTHVVQIFDCGVEAGAPYISMELLQGESLDARLAQRVWLSPEELNKVFGEVTLAIGNAHKMGVIHRDLKPGNIFLVREGELEITKVLDFGIAKVMSQSLSQTSGLGTRTGTLLGTPHYMSPEQARGSRDLDQSTDLWSLAIIAYECLTGQQPFSGSSLGDIVVQICTEEPRLPSSVADVPAGFDEWFLKGASKKPSDRFSSAREMADALSVVLLGREATVGAQRTSLLAGTGTLHSVPIPLTRREPAGSFPGASSAVLASPEAVPSSSPRSVALSAGSQPAASGVERARSLGATAALVARIRAGLAQLRSAPPVRGLRQGGEALAGWWRALLRWPAALRDRLQRAPARERWALAVSLLCGAAMLSFWYSTNQRGSSLPAGERTAVAAPLGEAAERTEPLEAPGRTEARAGRVPAPLPEASRELVSGSETGERHPLPAAARERRRLESSTGALRAGAARPRQSSDAEPPRSPPANAQPSPRRSKLDSSDPFADRL